MEEDQNRQHGDSMVGLIFVIVPIIYVLGVGPVSWGIQEKGWDDDWWEVVYAPLIWLHDNTFLDRPLEWYTDLFEG